MAQGTLHYVYDPLCGWCYGAGPLVRAAGTAGVPLALHGGGLFDSAVHVPADKRQIMRDFDVRISQMTGQPFGEDYLHGFLADPESVWWSRPTIAAVLAAEAIEAGQGPAMIAAIQRAHYVEGQRVVEEPVLVDLAHMMGLDVVGFTNSMRTAPVDAHIEETRRLMRAHGVQGFPTFLMERDGRFTRLSHESFYGRPEAFLAANHLEAGAAT